MTTKTIRSATAAALLVVVTAAGLTACGEEPDVTAAATVEQELKSREHEAYRDLAKTKSESVKPGEHLGRAVELPPTKAVKPTEHLGRRG
jgi:hypothetical protein